MSKMNQKASEVQKAPRRMTTFEKAERTLVTCLLGEDTYYEDGQSIKERLASYVPVLSEESCRKILEEAKVDNKLRHAPIFWAVQMAKDGKLKSNDVELITDRVDLMADLLSEYWRENQRSEDEIDSRRENHKRVNKMVPKQMVKGLQTSLKKFDEYQLAKYTGSKNEVKLRDVLKVVRPKPENDIQAALWGKVLKDELKTPDTWEVAISACGKDSEKKKAEWTRLLTEKTDKGYNKLGALALIRNLRNMEECGVSHDVIRSALKEMNVSKILPFQLIGAARHSSPEFADILQNKLLESIKNYEKLEGDTLFLLDTSGSMGGSLSSKSELNRLDACAGVAAILDGVCEESTLYTFNTQLEPISKAYHGMAMIDQVRSRLGGGTYLIDCTNEAIKKFCATHEGRFPSRVIVITDEQDNSYQYNGWGSHSNTPLMNLPKSCKGYIVNVASYEHGVNYKDESWTRISGWSEGIVKYVTEYEKLGKRK
jgi:hypothetical protein